MIGILGQRFFPSVGHSANRTNHVWFGFWRDRVWGVSVKTGISSGVQKSSVTEERRQKELRGQRCLDTVQEMMDKLQQQWAAASGS